MVLGDRTWTALVNVSGGSAAAGSLEFRPDQSVTGRLGGQDVATSSNLAGELAQLAELRRGIPAIGLRPRPERR
jgi:hypothetical protein